MFYTNEMIKHLGYKSIEEFVADYVKEHCNCSVRWIPSGVVLNYDFDSQMGVENRGDIYGRLKYVV